MHRFVQLYNYNMVWLGKIKPRRRELLGKQKILYSDMKSPLNSKKIIPLDKEEFLIAFQEKKAKEKKQRLILILILITLAILLLGFLI